MDALRRNTIGDVLTLRDRFAPAPGAPDAEPDDGGRG
jgi:hypothetical protein